MLKKIFISCLCALFFIFYAQAEEEPYDEAVSLGYGCQVAWQLKANGIRSLSYPFDWFHTPFNGLVGFITLKGSNFLDVNQISIVGPYAGDPGCLQVVDLCYGITSYHDFSANPPFANYWHIKLKYDRRIKRFFDLLKSNKRILFIRQGDSRHQIECLDALLQQIYPRLNYSILAVNDSEEYKDKWGSERIKNFHIKQIPWVWQGDYQSWKEVLGHFSIKANPHAFPD